MNEHLCLLVGVHFPIGSQHYWLWSDKCRHYLCFTWNIKRSFVRILELVNDFRQIPTCFAGASFLVQDFHKTCNSDTREDARIHMTVFFFTEFESAWNFTCLSSFPVYCPIPVRIFAPRRQSVLPSSGLWEKTIVFLSLTFATVSRDPWIMTESAWVSFRTLSMCLPLKTLSHYALNASFVWWVVWCVCVCVCCVVCVYMWCCVVVCVLCGCVLCGWCAFLCFCVVLLFFFSQFSLFLFLSAFPLLSSLFCLLFLFHFSLLSSLLVTKHCGKNRSTNTAANFEAFECDLPHGRCTAVGSLPPSLPSLLPSLPLLLKKKKKRELFITGIFPARNLFFITVLNKFQKLAAGENYCHYSFILIPKH